MSKLPKDLALPKEVETQLWDMGGTLLDIFYLPKTQERDHRQVQLWHVQRGLMIAYLWVPYSERGKPNPRVSFELLTGPATVATDGTLLDVKERTK